MEPYFPMFVNLKNCDIQIFGGGKIASRRAKVLLESGARVRVTAPEISSELKELAKEYPSLVLEYRSYRKSELKAPDYVLAATNDEAVNTMIFRECRHKDITVNVASNQEMCDFFFPGIVREGGITVGVTANGANHQKAAEVTRKIAELLKGGKLFEES